MSEWDEDAHPRDGSGRFISAGTIWYVDQQAKAHDKQHAAEQRAIEVAAETVKVWRADSNEWRKTLGDRDAVYATKVDANTLAARVDAVERGNIVRDERERNEKSAEVEDKRQSERRTARAQWQVGVVIGFVATAVAVAVQLWLRGLPN